MLESDNRQRLFFNLFCSLSLVYFGSPSIEFEFCGFFFYNIFYCLQFQNRIDKDYLFIYLVFFIHFFLITEEERNRKDLYNNKLYGHFGSNNQLTGVISKK